jgi:hypothetical protein
MPNCIKLKIITYRKYQSMLNKNYHINLESVVKFQITFKQNLVKINYIKQDLSSPGLTIVHAVTIYLIFCISLYSIFGMEENWMVVVSS